MYYVNIYIGDSELLAKSQLNHLDSVYSFVAINVPTHGTILSDQSHNCFAKYV